MKRIYLILLLTAISTSAQAKFPPIAFKNITKHFIDEKIYLSPLVGHTALMANIVSGYRFFGPFEKCINKDGDRVYAGDSSQDPLWNVVKILFPSSGGALSSDSSADANLGRYVQDPKIVTAFFIYTEYCRGYLNDQQAHDALKRLYKVTPKQPKQAPKKVTVNFENEITDIITSFATIVHKANFKRQTLKPLLLNIKAAIDQESKSKSTLPTHCVEQMISAFFCYKFDTRAHLDCFIQSLPATIVNPEVSISLENNTWDLEDILQITSILNQPASKSPPFLSLDEIFLLGIADYRTSPIPYSNGETLLSNSPCLIYDRHEDTFLSSDNTFPDCVEIAIRHLMNMVLYEPVSREFNLTKVKKLQTQHNPESTAYKNLQNLVDFYEGKEGPSPAQSFSGQPPEMANAGDILTRSWWNRVVGDLNTINDPLPVAYQVEDKANISSGFLSIIRTFQKIFSIDVGDEPLKDDKMSDKSAWITKAFQTLIDTLKPQEDYIYQLTMKNDLTKDSRFFIEKEIIGDISIKAFDKEEPLFDSRITATARHMAVKDVKTHNHTQNNFSQSSNSQRIPTFDNLSLSSLRLLLPFHAPSHPFYELQKLASGDNSQKISAIGMVVSGWIEDRYAQPETLINLLQALSWDDWHTVINYTTNLNALLKKFPTEQTRESESNKKLRDIIASHSQKLNINDDCNLTYPIAQYYLTRFKEVSVNNPNQMLNIVLNINGTNPFKTSTIEQEELVSKIFQNTTSSCALDELNEWIHLFSKNHLFSDQIDPEVSSRLKAIITQNRATLTISNKNDMSYDILHYYMNQFKEIIMQDAASALDCISKGLKGETLNISTQDQITLLQKVLSCAMRKGSDAAKEEVYTWLDNFANEQFFSGYLNPQEINDIKEVLFFEIKKIELKENTINTKKLDFYLTNFENLRMVGNCATPFEILEEDKTLHKNLVVKSKSNLVSLDLSAITLNQFSGLENFPKLEVLSMPKMITSGCFPSIDATSQLQRLDMSGTFGHSVDLGKLQALEFIMVENFQCPSLIFPKNSAHLKEILLRNSSINKIVGLNNLIALKTLTLQSFNTENLQLSSQNLELQNLNITHSKIKKTEGISYLKRLNACLLVGNCGFPSTLDLSENKEIENLMLRSTNIRSLKGLDKLSKLRSFTATDHELEELRFSKHNKNLARMNLSGSSVENLKALSNLQVLSSLEYIYLPITRNLEEMTVNAGVNVNFTETNSSLKITYVVKEEDDLLLN